MLLEPWTLAKDNSMNRNSLRPGWFQIASKAFSHLVFYLLITKLKNIQTIPSNQATYSISLIQPSSYWNSQSETLPNNLIFAPNAFAFQPTLHPWVFPGCACVRWSRAATRSRSGTRRSWPWTDVFGKVWEVWQIENVFSANLSLGWFGILGLIPFRRNHIADRYLLFNVSFARIGRCKTMIFHSMRWPWKGKFHPPPILQVS